MAIKTTGAEFKRFYNDKKYWPDNGPEIWHEDEEVLVNGAVVPEYNDAHIPDGAEVRLDGGMVFNEAWKGNEPSMETYFKRWRKEQTVKTVVVECDAAVLDAVLAAVKAAGGKVVK